MVLQKSNIPYNKCSAVKKTKTVIEQKLVEKSYTEFNLHIDTDCGCVSQRTIHVLEVINSLDFILYWSQTKA